MLVCTHLFPRVHTVCAASLQPQQERIRSLTDTRKMLIDENWDANSGRSGVKRQEGNEEETSKMVEDERRRLEVSKRRGEKELNQVRRVAFLRVVLTWHGRKTMRHFKSERQWSGAVMHRTPHS